MAQTKAELLKENERLRRENAALKRAAKKHGAESKAAIAEALQQQAATSEILRVISSSPTDVQPVFDAIVQSAVRLCGAAFGAVYRCDGRMISLAAHEYSGPEWVEIAQRIFPAPLNEEAVIGRTIITGRVLHIDDVDADPEIPPKSRSLFQALGMRSSLIVPMHREDQTIGGIVLSNRGVEAFTEAHVELLKTFADQAVIAIANVRLFKELEARNAELTESLARQIATSEVLRAISQAQTDAQPVFEIIAASARRLCSAAYAQVQLYDGELIYLAALESVNPEGDDAIRAVYPLRVGDGSAGGRAIATRAVTQIPDLLDDRAYAFTSVWQASGLRSLLAVPMLRDGRAIGTIGVGRAEPGPFPQTQIDLLQTFADQAVIAIENVRLFKELETRNKDLTVALEQQTATSEILRVISSSQTDVQPVFDTIVRSAVRLCDGLFCGLFQFDGELIHHVAHHNFTPEALKEMHRIFPARPTRALLPGRAILERAVVHIPDVLELDPEFRVQAVARTLGFRSGLWVPMLREGAPLGVISVTRAEPGSFSDDQIALLKTFADQAVIAIENVRLFKELQTRTGELTQSVDKLTALGEVSRAVSSTLDVETVLTTIVSRAIQLSGTDAGTIWEYDETAEQFHLRAAQNFESEIVAILRAMPLRRGEGSVGRLADTRAPMQIADISGAEAYRGRLDVMVRAGYRAVLVVPLLREDHLIGALTVNGKTAREFAPEVVDLLTTFATQSALAIQNARLFREIADKSRQLEVASQHKSEFLANMSHELRTPLNAIIGFSEVLSEGMFGEINEKQTEYLRDILESGRHLLSLINDILDLSKIEAGHMELEPTDFDLPGAIENALILVRERASRRGIGLGRTIDPHLGAIRADERKVKQVLLNLLSNALKFTPEGGRIEVRAHVIEEMAEISVADTGVGIAPEDQEAVFEEFRQVGTAEKKVEGTGLGLALSRKFVELHGGKIWVKSQVGVGSTFTFTLPLR